MDSTGGQEIKFETEREKTYLWNTLVLKNVLVFSSSV